MAAPMAEKVELGFAEKSPDWRLISQFFPSKIGGKPAWLNLQEVPGQNEISCPVCGKIAVFLLQVYSPPAPHGDTETDSGDCPSVPPDLLARCFHRSVYIFCCREPQCHKSSREEPRVNPFIILRCQLERHNQFFSYEPPDVENEIKQDDVVSPSTFGVNVCDVCGCNAGTKKCGRCNASSYCCKDHQILHWKAGHKNICGKNFERGNEPNQTKLLFPEFELVIEHEEDADENEVNPSDDTSGSFEKQGGKSVIDELHNQTDFSVAELESMAKKETEDDEQFLAFKKRIAGDPDQVLRYQKGGCPLFVSASQQPTEEDIPLCPCGAKRQFEFQVMPQLLTDLKVDSLGDSIDWGTLLVYTCTESCEEGPAYHKEFLWKQDFHQSSV